MHEDVTTQNTNNNYNEQTPRTGSTDFAKVIDILYSSGRPMIPSSGIMSSPSDRRDKNHGTTTQLNPQHQLNSTR